ncbi:MAG TPA: class I SAM-dependent methyltransferase [Streptosporangiaceae bacterium]
MPQDYDADPGRFLASSRWQDSDVHPYVAARFRDAGARQVLDVGGGNGKLATLLPGLGMRCLLVDISPAMLALAPRPAVRADGAKLPVAAGSCDAVAALYTLYHYDDPVLPIREARRVLRPGGLFAACSASRDSAPELAHVVPGWGAPTTFDADESPAIVRSVFGQPGDEVSVQRWDAPMHTLTTAEQAAAFLRCYGMGEQAARDAAQRLALPLTLTMRGCFVYATKAPAGTAPRG